MAWSERKYKWLFEPPYDPEYKYYLFMATVQKWDEMLRKKVLFPEVILLPQLEKELEKFLQKMETVTETYEDFISKNIETLLWDENIEGDILEGYKLLMDFALEKVKDYGKRFQELRHEIEQHIVIEEIGILPLHKQEGFLILEEPEKGEKLIQFFYYQLGMIQWYELPTYQIFWIGQKRGIHFSKWYIEGSKLIKHYALPHSIPPAIVYSYCDLEDIPIERTQLPLIISRYWDQYFKHTI